MSLIPYVRQQVIQQLWQNYLAHYPVAQKIVAAIKKPVILDHFAMIDLPSTHTGIATLNQIFSALNYLPQGRDYLADKQNEFMWLAPAEIENETAMNALPQIVIADFQFADLSSQLQNILKKYTRSIPAFPWQYFHQLCGKVYHDDVDAAEELIRFIITYCQQRDWPAPSLNDYLQIKENNELLAWVLVFGRHINHFGISIHLLKDYADLTQFNNFIQKALSITLNKSGGLIKGDVNRGVAQSSTEGDLISQPLADGEIQIYSPFIEFVWRYAKVEHPIYWKDYFTGFIGAQANYVIESVMANAD